MELYGEETKNASDLVVETDQSNYGILLAYKNKVDNKINYIVGKVDNTNLSQLFKDIAIKPIAPEKYFEVSNIFMKEIENDSVTLHENVSFSSTKAENDVSLNSYGYNTKNEWTRFINDFVNGQSTINLSNYNIDTSVLIPTETTVGQALWRHFNGDLFSISRCAYYDINQNKYNIYVSFVNRLNNDESINSSTKQITYELGNSNVATNATGFHATYWRSNGNFQYIYNKGMKLSNITIAVGNVQGVNSKNVIYETLHEYRMRKSVNGSVFQWMQGNSSLVTVAKALIAKKAPAIGVVADILTSLNLDDNPTNARHVHPMTYETQLNTYQNTVIRDAATQTGDYFLYELGDFIRLTVKVNTPGGSTGYSLAFNYTAQP